MSVHLRSPDPPAEDLYEQDILAWSEAQSVLLRRARDRLGAAAGAEGVDWDHVIEEIEDVGRSELRAAQSHLRQAMLHLMKIAAYPHSGAVEHWISEAIAQLTEAQAAFAPSMARRISLSDLHRQALQVLEPIRSVDGRSPLPIAANPAFDLAALLAAPADAQLVRRLAAHLQAGNPAP